MRKITAFLIMATMLFSLSAAGTEIKTMRVHNRNRSAHRTSGHWRRILEPFGV